MVQTLDTPADTPFHEADALALWRPTDPLAAAARTMQGKSLREIANTTNIAPRILQALDRDDVSLLPSEIFGRGFVRAYAREVGIDPEPLVAELVARAHDAAPRSEPKAEDERASRVSDAILDVVEASAIALMLWLALYVAL